MGLGASVWTKDMVQGERVAQQLEVGNVRVNAYLEVAPAFPFGGHKQSEIGTEWGTAGLKSFYNTQALYVKKESRECKQTAAEKVISHCLWPTLFFQAVQEVRV
jgi:acyl-CoA reductase-like NAD-dependent aldehyde dehydrogenase